MTVVLGQKFGDTIVLLSDTMITDPVKGRTREIPGRLKLITLGLNLTIAYAGHTDQALTVIRSIAGGDVSELPVILETLRKASSSEIFDVEFLVASHSPIAELRRIWDGRISAPLETGHLGNPHIRKEVLRRFSPKGVDRHDAKELGFSFIASFTNKRVDRGEGVGGFPIVVTAAPDNHHYRFHSMHESWKPIEFIPGATTYENPDDLLCGDWSYHHSVMPPQHPGVPLVAVLVPQAHLGFVYDPLHEDEPRSIELLSRELKWTDHERPMMERLKEELAQTEAQFSMRIRSYLQAQTSHEASPLSMEANKP